MPSCSYIYLQRYQLYCNKVSYERTLNKIVCKVGEECFIYDKKIQITQTVCLTTILWATLEYTKERKCYTKCHITRYVEKERERTKSLFIKGWLTIIRQTTLRINILLWSHDNITYIRAIRKIRSQLTILLYDWTFFLKFPCFLLCFICLIMMTSEITVIPHV